MPITLLLAHPDLKTYRHLRNYYFVLMRLSKLTFNFRVALVEVRCSYGVCQDIMVWPNVESLLFNSSNIEQRTQPKLHLPWTDVDTTYYVSKLRWQRDQVQLNEIAYQFMTFYQIGLFSFICLLHGLVIFRKQNIAFSADQLILQKRKLYFSIAKPCRFEFEAMVFNQEQLLYCTQSLYPLNLNSTYHIPHALVFE